MKVRVMQRQDGFTLIEAIMVILILAIVFAVSALALKRGFASYFLGKDMMQADWQGRVALERMTRELREIRSRADLSLSPSNQITFTDTDGNTISYSLSGGNLLRNTQTVGSGVSVLAFTYLTSSFTTTTLADDVHYVTVEFTEQQGDAVATYRTTVNPRNFP